LWLWGVSKNVGEKKVYHIVEKTKIWFGVSGVIIGICLIAFIFTGLKLGIDFKGGTLMDVKFEKQVTADQIKSELKNIQDSSNAGATTGSAANTTGTAISSETPKIVLDNSRIVTAGEENGFLINLEHIDNETHEKILEGLKNKLGNLTENKYTTIGPVVGSSLKQKALFAVLIAMTMIILYIAFAFRKVPKKVSPWKFGVCAIVALIHDVIIPIGIFSVLKLEVDALFITAMLTVLGFSVHDTIVVFDRIRENLKYQDRDESFTHVANKSMSQTMTRSINTSLTVLITLLALLIFGSSSVFNFVLVLVIGILVGTYSSIFIASPLLVMWQKKSEQK
jgi:preprotein translocase subunit SecF